MQIRVHIFARASHRSNLVMTTSTTDTSHRSMVEAVVQELLHIQLHYDVVGGWLEALDEIIDLIIVRS